ncbi:hypothetical protein [Cytobacillus firmus]|uniref:hypothetical protein n=1 Tax=Cytobacillus firmus TaxID=1399 RepID=UPI0018CD6425|nr:hypothetical protein [Cytobacillus firmus]MBG9589525.1 hypothetical protein [Cytobacillus firmus]
MKIFKIIILALWLLGMFVVYVFMFWNAAFPYNEEEHKREEFAEEKAKVRAKAVKQMQIEYMLEHH